MMSQNRQEKKDRERSENDYKTNLKSELEIRLLSEKIDRQNKRLLAIQHHQIESLGKILRHFEEVKDAQKSLEDKI